MDLNFPVRRNARRVFVFSRFSLKRDKIIDLILSVWFSKRNK